MNKILEQIIQKIENRKSLDNLIDTYMHLAHKPVENYPHGVPIYFDNKLVEQNTDIRGTSLVDTKAIKSRFHCLPLDLDKAIEDNGVAVLSPSVDITHDSISPLHSSFEAIKTTDDINIEYNEELIPTNNKVICDADILSLRLAIETQNERLERLERAIERLAENGERSNTQPRSEVNRIIQLYDQTPNKITIQYFLNTGKKIPPRVKLELRHKVRDINGKPYYPTYQTIYGNCYKDYGISKFDKFSKFSINDVFCDDMKPLREFISDARSALTETDDMIGTFFYDVDTTEIFLDAYVVINKTDGWGKLFLYNGNEFSEEAFEFATSKARAGSKCPDGIYTINHDKITNMLGL